MKTLLSLSFLAMAMMSQLALAFDFPFGHTTHYNCIASSGANLDLSWKNPFGPTGIKLKELGAARLYDHTIPCKLNGNPISGGDYIIHNIVCDGSMTNDQAGTTTLVFFFNTAKKTGRIAYATSMAVNGKTVLVDTGVSACTQKSN
jgi:hypothetical protein